MMKTTLDAKELRELRACENGYQTFINKHQESKVNFSQALESNGWDDIWWYLGRVWNDLSQRQRNDLLLLSCGCAESCLRNFELEFPKDDRPRKAIESAKLFIAGELSLDELCEAESAARSAAEYAAESAARSAAESAAESAARSAAESAAESAAWSAWSAAWSAWSAAEYAAVDKNTSMLKELFLKWESCNEK